MIYIIRGKKFQPPSNSIAETRNEKTIYIAINIVNYRMYNT